MKQFVIVAKDKKGLVAEIAGLLGSKGINIDSFAVQVIGPNAIVHLVISAAKEVEETLKKAGYNIISSDVILINLENKPGELSRVAKLLSDGDVNIQNMHLLFKTGMGAVCAIKVDSYAQATKILKNYLV
ncbi:ACT domain-containing protein [Candidatus Micrarchaeota archaeon]|nr:ACT domain-containing protein [Candidatus Micrarchaeota archaeon]